MSNDDSSTVDMNPVSSPVQISSSIESIPASGLPSVDTPTVSEIPSHGLTPPEESSSDDEAPITSLGSSANNDPASEEPDEVRISDSSLFDLPTVPDNAKWSYEPVSRPAPQYISSSINPNNILSSRRRHAHLAKANPSVAPKTFKQAMRGTMRATGEDGDFTRSVKDQTVCHRETVVIRDAGRDRQSFFLSTPPARLIFIPLVGDHTISPVLSS
ncbi:uncharacterized protein MELLADRAFT_112957 [Melampsora larici-populina 98AG31]|uniref:Uncharacterized protein n=1 Tax=Melampsora larici-populina (strain 98AG31 / pathotype 3-4-7) TaxID=747676 RepID=F4S885_MELLP|nr:uncharacterized protein MELLADRAFT_112957 [Melampsora larici-populina 98AG31]EGF99141.1 hypothetical protein MELLADRAFT_112957 [Melampsora larici-populina 98AG31]